MVQVLVELVMPWECPTEGLWAEWTQRAALVVLEG